MSLRNLDNETLAKIQGLVEVRFSGRDKLYSVASHLDDSQRSSVCRKLADHLAGHAAELQQILL